MANAKIAAVRGAESATVQALFEEATSRWRAADIHVAGLIEETHGLEGRSCNAGVLRDIVSGKRHSIYLEALPEGATCHIDSTGAESACATVLEQIKNCDLLVLSKFGKLEAAHGGLIGAFEAAVAEGKPVLTTVSDKHLESWREFAPAATILPANTEAIEKWWTSLHADDPSRPAENRAI